VSGPETFISRWSRLKRDSDKEREAEPAGLSPSPNAVEAKPVGGDPTTAAPAEASDPAPPVFDPARLPPIESISLDTDIQSFLQSGVPAELTRAALRRAWVTDPAIRDFIGIAENQWDFTDPTAIPGFGPLTAADDVPRLVTQMLGRADDALAQIAEASFPAGPAAPVSADGERGGSVVERREESEILAKGPAGADIASLAGEQDKAEGAAEHHRVAEECTTRRNRRSHGGALPR
jgi:Protein of unknown function (DUF3306)